jgi:hypothetical protein
MTPESIFRLSANRENLIAIPAATATAAAPSAISTAAATTAASALDFRTRFIYVQRASSNLSAVERRNGLVSVFGTRHLNEAEATRAPGIPVGHDADTVYLSMYLEKLSQFIFPGVEVEVANKNVLQANCL